MGRGAWWDAVHGVAKSRTRLSDFTFTLSDMSVATVALLFFICIKYLFPSFHFDSMCVSKPEVSPYRNHIVEFFFLIHPVILCLLIGEFNSFTLRVIVDR